MSTKRKSRKNAAGFWLLIYSVLMIWLLFFGSRTYGTGSVASRCNFVPLQTIRQMLVLMKDPDGSYVAFSAINLIGNVVMFVPLGFLLPKTYPKLKNFFRMLFWVIVIVVLIETLQLITTLGSCDIDDLILNVTGAILGYLIWATTK